VVLSSLLTREGTRQSLIPISLTFFTTKKRGEPFPCVRSLSAMGSVRVLSVYWEELATTERM